MLDKIKEEQDQNLIDGRPEMADRLRNIQYLVYEFIHKLMRKFRDNIEYLLHLGSVNDDFGKEILQILIESLNNQVV